MGYTFKTKWKAVTVNCLNCGKEFLKRDRPYRGSSRGKLRPSHVKTCCHKCSVEMIDKNRMIYERLKRLGVHGAQLQ